MKNQIKCDLHKLLSKKKCTFSQSLIRYVNLEIFILSMIVEDLVEPYKFGHSPFYFLFSKQKY
jgi:hypothetical protein